MGKNLHVVMVPWSAYGHLIPFFQLSIGLAKAGIKVSFITTPKIVKRLPQIPPDLATLLEFVALPLPALDDKELLPEGAEVTVEIPSGRKQYLKIAYDLLKNPIRQFISDQQPDWIITDMFPYWVAEVGQENQIPIVFFSVFSASTNAFYMQKSYNSTSKTLEALPSLESFAAPPPPAVGEFSSSVTYQSFEAASRYKDHYENKVSGISDMERCAIVIQASKALAIHTCPEYEGEYLNKCKEMTGKPVIPVGLLLPEKPKSSDHEKSWVQNFEWLDQQKPNSVVYVGFGSEYQLSKEQIQQIAYGLELSGLPFLWALRKPYWSTNTTDDDPDHVLPPGFNDRTSRRGVVCMDWAPQLEILGHPSIGGMLFHAGWNSIIETLQFGHSLVVLPCFADQPLNARLVVDKGLAVEVERSVDGSFDAHDIAKALNIAMVSKEGENIRARAKEAVHVCGNRNLQDIYFGRFVEYLNNNGGTAADDQSQ